MIINIEESQVVNNMWGLNTKNLFKSE
jgi:hypothetical protein